MESKTQERAQGEVALFIHPTNKLTPVGSKIAVEIREALKPLFNRYAKENISMLQLGYLIKLESTCLALKQIALNQGEAE